MEEKEKEAKREGGRERERGIDFVVLFIYTLIGQATRLGPRNIVFFFLRKPYNIKFVFYGLYNESPTALVYEHLLLEKLTLEFPTLSQHKVHKE